MAERAGEPRRQKDRGLAAEGTEHTEYAEDVKLPTK